MVYKAYYHKAKEVVELARRVKSNVPFNSYRGAQFEKLQGGELFKNDALAVRRNGLAMCVELLYPYYYTVIEIDDGGVILKGYRDIAKVGALLEYCLFSDKKALFTFLIRSLADRRFRLAKFLDVDRDKGVWVWKNDDYGTHIRYFDRQTQVLKVVAEDEQGRSKVLLDSASGLVDVRGIVAALL